MPRRSKTTTVTSTTTTITYGAKELRNLLGIPERAEVFVDVPGGGDWSNMQLDICADTPLVFRWTDTKEEESEE